MLDLAQRGRGAREATPATPVLKTIASTGAGIEPLVHAIDAARPADPEVRLERRRLQAEAQVLAIAGEIGRLALRRQVDGAAGLVDDVAARRRNPYGAAAELIAAIGRR